MLAHHCLVFGEIGVASQMEVMSSSSVADGARMKTGHLEMVVMCSGSSSGIGGNT